MPKIRRALRRARSLSLERSRMSPYPVDPNFCESCKNDNSLESAQNVKEWEQARCPICMEQPHNAVLLKCSSHEKGCRPFMCNTSHRHSNCFEQFCKLYGPIPLITEMQEISFTSVASHRQMDECLGRGGNHLASELICPLCRGDIYGYMVVEPARQYMNSKLRSCSSETCDFSGTYSELRKHARSEHPSVRPSEVDPVRRYDWARSQRQRDFADILSLVQSDSALDSDEDLSFTRAIRFWMSSYVNEMYGSLMDSISDSMVDALGELETLQSRLDNMHRSPHSTEVVYNFSFETRPYSQPAQPWDLRFSQHMPRATHLHGQNQQQRVVESTSQSRQLRWRRQTSFESAPHAPEPRRQHGSMYKSAPRASQLRWRNQRWSASASSSSNHNER